MTIFDLIFLLAMLATVITIIGVAVLLLRRRNASALRWLRNYGIGLAVYLTVSLGVAAFKPQRVVPVGEAWCFDDWCLTAQKVSRTAAGDRVSYKVDLLVSSRAGRVTQRAKGAWLYLIDEHGHRYAPEPDPSAVPLDVLLQPGEMVGTSRVFEVPAGVREVGLITGHGGPYCGPMDILVIGDGGCVFGKPAMIKIQ